MKAAYDAGINFFDCAEGNRSIIIIHDNGAESGGKDTLVANPRG